MCHAGSINRMSGGTSMDRPAYRDFDAAAPSLRRARPNIFARIVRLILEGPLYVVLIWVALAAAGSTYSALTTTLDFTGTGLVALDPELASAERALEAAFPGTGEPIVAVIDSDDPKAARDAAANLARAFAGEPHIFSAAYAPGTEQFFDRYGVLYLDRAEVENTVRRIEQSAPLYRAITASPDFAGLAALAGEAARAIAGGRSPQGLNALFQEAALTVRGEIEGHRHDLDWPGLVKHAAGPDSKHWYVLTTPLAAK